MLFTPSSLSNFIAGQLYSQTVDKKTVTQLLLEYITKKSKIDLVKIDKIDLPDKKVHDLKTFISKINSGTPIEHITNTRGFYGLDFFVNENVLIPRPETELLVDLAREKISSRLSTNTLSSINILEIGTGSGCIPISIIKTTEAENYQDTKINFFATDISKQALNIAKKNVNKLLDNFIEEKLNSYSKFNHKNTNLFILNMDIINPIGSLELDLFDKGIKFDLIISNPPYIPEKSIVSLPDNVKNEPRNALVGGKNGFEIIEKLLNQTKNLLKKNGEYLIEFSEETLEIANKRIPKILTDYEYKVINDLTQKPRILYIYKSTE